MILYTIKQLKKVLFYSVCAISLFWSAGCLDEIDFSKSDTIDDSIAIQGKLIKGNPSTANVTIRKVFNFEDSPRLIDAREVTITSDDGATLELKSNAAGIFFLEIPDDHPTFKVDYGKSYKINVLTFDNRSYESSFEELFPVPTPDDLEVRRTQIETKDVNGNNKLFEQLSFYANTPLKPEGSSQNARLLWELISTFKFSDTPTSYGQRACWPTRIDEDPKTCFVSQSPVQNYISLNGPNLSTDRVDNYELLSTGLNSTYSEGFYLTVIQQSLSPTAYDYWSQVSQVVDRSGDIFEAPAGKVATNLIDVNDPKGEIFGYFYATEEKVKRIYVAPELAGNPPLPCPAPPSESGQAPGDCCNCTILGGSTTVKPVWWIQ